VSIQRAEPFRVTCCLCPPALVEAAGRRMPVTRARPIVGDHKWATTVGVCSACSVHKTPRQGSAGGAAEGDIQHTVAFRVASGTSAIGCRRPDAGSSSAGRPRERPVRGGLTTSMSPGPASPAPNPMACAGWSGMPPTGARSAGCLGCRRCAESPTRWRRRSDARAGPAHPGFLPWSQPGSSSASCRMSFRIAARVDGRPVDRWRSL
jgi:hypothetical protein